MGAPTTRGSTRASPHGRQHGLDPSHPLAAQIRPDLERQLAADLQVIAERLGGPSARGVAFVGSGPMLSWYETACAQAGNVDLVLVTAEPDEAWLEKAATLVAEL
jgi:hypothetical protein